MPHELIYRDDIRRTPPNILLTNPTMLEYMLLRPSDQPILQNSQGRLKWIVIDETHTFTGAGAAELALLVRRVLQAFGVTVDNVRFATSSATIGDDDINNTRLKQFIADISGKVPADIEVIKGKRVANDSQKVDIARLPRPFGLDINRLDEIQAKLINDDFVKLSDLIPEKDTIVEKLEILDALGEANLPAKVHYFFKVLDCGLNVLLTDISTNNTFNLYTVEKIDNNDGNVTPLLELCRCKRCGNFVAFGQIESKGQDTYRFKRRVRENENIFLTEDDEEENGTQQNDNTGGVITFGIKPLDGQESTNFKGVAINKDFIITNEENANLIALEGANCPFCSNLNNEANTNNEDDLIVGFQSFRVSSEFISRIIAPRLLDEMIKHDISSPYNGSQFLSFVDSRQGASRATLKQNLFNENRWVQSRVFHWLTKFETDRIQSIQSQQNILNTFQGLLNGDPQNQTYIDFVKNAKATLESLSKGYKRWDELLDYIIQDPDFELLCEQFIKDEDFYHNGNIKDKAKREYAQVVLFEEFNRRPKSALIAETLGFVQTCYPKLDTIQVLPDAVNQFNNLLKEENKISLDEWKNFLKIYLDYTVRSNGSLYFIRNDWTDIDIFSSQRFQSKKNPRRPAVVPQFNERGSQNRFVYLLAAVAGWDRQARTQNKDTIEQVLNALWYDVTRCGIIVWGQVLNDRGQWVNEAQEANVNPPYRMNIADMALKVGLTGAICPVTNRPIDVTFKGYSPYIKNASAHKVETIFDWTESPFPHINGKDKHNEKVTNEQIETWATANRSELTELGLWTSVSNLICSYPQTFIQAEHTAQVNKDLAKQHQQDFKDHKINILACSTTMEMGIDLGDLELVVMNSIPPHPANYKQRAGRSGRNDFPKSCALTFCNSDPIGMRTMKDPMSTLITRPTAVPMVDLNSPQVVQRHVNAFLFKSWIGTLSLMNERIIEFFTTYHFLISGKEKEDITTVQNNDNQQISAAEGIGDVNGTRYREFVDFLNNIPDEIKANLRVLIKDTCFEETSPQQLANNTISAIERVHNELKTKFRLIQEEWSANLTPKQKTRLNFRFSSMLSKNLIMYLSTHQFTPNANMPVNIIEFDTKTVPNDWGRSNNPSYELKQALSQYVPGNTVVLDNSCYIVRGVAFTNQFNHQNTFKQIQQCNSCGKTWIDNHGKCLCPPASIKIWEDINGKNNLELIEPVGFTRDINEDYNRIKNSNVFTYVNAQLIGADNWSDTDHHQRLFEFRSSQEDETSQILFYNLGIGYGFCVCKLCGKAVIEYRANVPNDCLVNLPFDFNNEIGNIGGEERMFHYDIRREKNQLNRHFGKIGNDCTLKRNMLLGGTIQTDYCEIKLYDNQRNVVWDSELLHTLGITLTNVLAKYIGIERKDISFIVLNDSICIYDTAKGGAGYSKRLNNTQMLYTIFDLTLEELRNCTYKEDLIDRSTKQYVDKINIGETLSWLELEKASREIVPDIIKAIYPNAKTAKFQDIIDNYIPNGDSKFLFINSKFERWNYEEWKLRLLKIRQSAINGNKVKLCFYGEINQVPVPAINLLNAISDWADLHYCQTADGLYPIAKINNKFFFTDDESQLQISSRWASDDLYCTDGDDKIPEIKGYNIPQPVLSDGLGVVKFTIPEKTKISSKGLYKKLKQANTETEALINNFKQKCLNNGLEIRYKDEHLKSKLGIIITLQFINELARDLECKIDKLIIENEEYTIINNGRVDSLTANAPDSDSRDELIHALSEAVEIEYNEKGKMPHWRVLEVACNGFQLNIYPNGGFANGWIINKEQGIYYRYIDTTLSTDINLLSREEIMFDVEINGIANFLKFKS